MPYEAQEGQCENRGEGAQRIRVTLQRRHRHGVRQRDMVTEEGFRSVAQRKMKRTMLGITNVTSGYATRHL